MLAIVAAVLGFLIIGGLGLAFAGPGTSGTVKRAKAISERNRAERKLGGRPQPVDPTLRRKQIVKTLRDEERRQRKASVSMSARLQQAGLTISVRTFWIVSGVLGLMALFLAIFLGQTPLVALALGAVAGLGLPRWLLAFLYKRRSKKFGESFADASDIIVRGIKSGLPVHECLNIIGRESPEPLASEFRRMVDGVAHGMSMEQALQKMYERMPLAELRFFSIVISIQQKTGGNLAEALSNLSAVLRARKLMREKVKAMASEATASAMIIGSLPPGVMILISLTTPSYLTILFTTSNGKMLLAGSVLWMATGVFTMRKMINFKL